MQVFERIATPIFPFVQVFLILCFFNGLFLIFIRMFDKTDIQCSSEVGHKTYRCVQNEFRKRNFFFVTIPILKFYIPLERAFYLFQWYK